MSKNQNRPTTVINNPAVNFAEMTTEERIALMQSLSASLPVSARVEFANAEKTKAQSDIDAEVTRINAEIEAIREKIKPLNEAIGALMAEKTKLGLKVKAEGDRTRVVTECPECGSKAHNVNRGEVTTCNTYASSMEAKSKDEKHNAEQRAKYAANAAKIRAAIAARAS